MPEIMAVNFYLRRWENWILMFPSVPVECQGQINTVSRGRINTGSGVGYPVGFQHITSTRNVEFLTLYVCHEKRKLTFESWYFSLRMVFFFLSFFWHAYISHKSKWVPGRPYSSFLLFFLCRTRIDLKRYQKLDWNLIPLQLRLKHTRLPTIPLHRFAN